jgi:hypothetical protein
MKILNRKTTITSKRLTAHHMQTILMRRSTAFEITEEEAELRPGKLLPEWYPVL